MKRAINAAEKAKKAYEDGRAKVAEAGKAIQDHANLEKDLQAVERQVRVYESKFADLSSALESARLSAKEAVEVALEESERAKASEIEAAVQEAIRKYRYSPDFSTLLDKEVGSEVVDLIYRFKRYNPRTKLNLNFIADPPSLPEGVTEEMIEEYEGEDASGEPDATGAEERAINAAEKAKKAYEDGRAKVAEAGKAIQDHANLEKDLQAVERQVRVYESKFADLSSALESARLSAKEAVEVALEESERAKASEIEAAVQEAIRKYRYSPDFSTLLDKEVGSEVVDLIYRFKRYNPRTKLNLNFIADPPSLPEGVTEEMIEEYEGEDASGEPDATGAEEADAEEAT
ncbi:PREDICTED: uncharacterized protein LOC103343308 [Prunus mume]|uniref:Uncharacterized protein LOC103343308 n=1 Tax=Prunus mume TaxID=102107 RepID=A0ABM0PVL6_PRUMU|nr:PREDICTED: uncharacterized protein LOC103343308 [Prunus mume]